MDPKDLNQLDPKLREAYERVMGTNVSPTPPAPSEGTAMPQVASPDPTQSVEQPSPVAPQSSQVSQEPQAPPQIPESPAQQGVPASPPPVYQAYNAESENTQPTQDASSAHHISRFAISTPILVVLGIAFFCSLRSLVDNGIWS